MATGSGRRPPARRAPAAPARAGGSGGGQAIPFGQPPGPRQAGRPPRRLYGGPSSPVRVAGARPVIVDPQQSAGRAVKGAPRVLMAEFLACLVIVAAKPFEKTGDSARISEGSIGQFAAVMILFFILALVGGTSDKSQKIANLFGALVTLGLLLKNTASIKSVTASITAGAKPKAPAAATGADTAPQGGGPIQGGTAPVSG